MPSRQRVAALWATPSRRIVEKLGFQKLGSFPSKYPIARLGPCAASYNNSKVLEALSVNGVMQNTCSQYVSECNGSATFTVGTGGTDYGVPFNPANNIFYDDHSLTNTSSILSGTGLSTCSYSCNQTYYAVSDPAGNSCSNANLGSFLITYTLKTDTIQSTPVTRVTVAKH